MRANTYVPCLASYQIATKILQSLACLPATKNRRKIKYLEMFAFEYLKFKKKFWMKYVEQGTHLNGGKQIGVSWPMLFWEKLRTTGYGEVFIFFQRSGKKEDKRIGAHPFKCFSSFSQWISVFRFNHMHLSYQLHCALHQSHAHHQLHTSRCHYPMRKKKKNGMKSGDFIADSHSVFRIMKMDTMHLFAKYWGSLSLPTLPLKTIHHHYYCSSLCAANYLLQFICI